MMLKIAYIQAFGMAHLNVLTQIILRGSTTIFVRQSAMHWVIVLRLQCWINGPCIALHNIAINSLMTVKAVKSHASLAIFICKVLKMLMQF